MKETLERILELVKKSQLSYCYNIVNGPALKDLYRLFLTCGFYSADKPAPRSTAEVSFVIENMENNLKLHHIDAMQWVAGKLFLKGSYWYCSDGCDDFVALYDPKTLKGILIHP